MLEKDFISKLRRKLRGVFHKNWGGGWSNTGLPDLEGCINGRSYLIEAKIAKANSEGRLCLRSPLTKIQKNWLKRYKKNGAVALVAVYVENLKKIAFFDIDAFENFERVNLSQKLEDLREFWRE